MLSAAVLVVIGTAFSWYRLTPHPVAIPEAIKSIVRQYFLHHFPAKRGVQTVSGVVSIGAALISVTTLLLISLRRVALTRGQQLGGVSLGCGAIVLATALWSLFQRPDAAHWAGFGSGHVGSYKIVQVVNPSVGIGVGLLLTIAGGAALIVTSLALLVIERSSMPDTGAMAMQEIPMETMATASHQTMNDPTASTAKRYCSTCGRQFDDASQRFCAQCGATRSG